MKKNSIKISKKIKLISSILAVLLILNLFPLEMLRADQTDGIPNEGNPIEEPVEGNDDPTPTPEDGQEEVTPTPEGSDDPTPTEEPAEPTPTEVPAEPTPTEEPEDLTPTPTEEPADPTPTEVPADPTPTEVPVEPTPTEVPASPTPTEVPATPTEVPATPTPTEEPVKPTPTEEVKKPTPTEEAKKPTPTKAPSGSKGGLRSTPAATLTFLTTQKFIEFCEAYKNDGDYVDSTLGTIHARDYWNAKLELALTNDLAAEKGVLPSSFSGLGTADKPFGGIIGLYDNGASGGFKFTDNGASFFNYVYDSVRIISNLTSNDFGIKFERGVASIADGQSVPFFASHVVDDPDNAPASWTVEVVSSNTGEYSGIIGEIGSGANVTLNYTNSSGNNISNKVAAGSSDPVPDVGAVCGKISSGATLNLTYSETSSSYSITSYNGNAGGLIGTMEGTAVLNITSMPNASSAKSVESKKTGGYAGGLVGEITSDAQINYSGTIPVAGSVTAVQSAGGLFGHYTNKVTEFDVSKYNVDATVSGQYSGGLFGVLENNNTGSALSLTIKNTGNAGAINVATDETAVANGYFGGVAGRYTTNALTNNLVLKGLTITAEAKAAYSAFGGVIGIADSASYIKTEDTVTVNAKGTTLSDHFGGLIGTTGSSGVFVDLYNFTLNTNSESLKGGGVVGQFNKGVLRLNGTTDMTRAKITSGSGCGQLVGVNDNVLVYSKGTGSDSNWTFKRSTGSKADDLGTWGEVVRGIDDTTSGNTVYFDSAAHTATIAAAKTSMGSADDLTRTALNIQLNQGTNYNCLLFTTGNNTRATLLGSTLSLSSDIPLAGTGITGLMRDGGSVASIGSFTGTFEGNGHTITLATGEKYGNGVTSSSTAEGIGQIYRHNHTGLFAVLAGTVKDLTVVGTINVNNRVDGMNIGGIASRNGGNVTLTNVHANETVNYYESTAVASSGEGKNIGGFIGYVGTNGTITVNGQSSIGATFDLSGHHTSWNVYGGAIGKISAGTFTVDIGTTGGNTNKLTDSLMVLTSGITNVGANGDGGGLIGHITNAGSYADRKVNIKNLEFSNCTIANAASTNGGGFLGYSWLNTTTIVDGLTANGTIVNTTGSNVAGNIGVMLYCSTGKMVVNSLNVTGLTMSTGGADSIGMIVNKAYTYDSGYTGGLYLDVLSSGYKLNSGISVSGTVFDEIAAYSAKDANDIIGGGAGVVSINMNSSRSGTAVKMTDTGTYQNQLKTGNDCANQYCRYYYNIDKMSSSDAGQNLLLWSLKKYAYSGINGEFATTFTNTLSGTADMTGLSFYPIKNANDNYTLGNLTLTFDYSGIRGTAENVSDTDSYVRDPSALNQHHLMHSGLFIDQPSGNSLTISGDVSIAGTFLEDGSRKGVIISGTMKGTFNCNSGSIVLDGIKPMNGASAYTSGYLLINNVSRTDDLATPPSITIKNLSTTNKYSSSGSTDIVAKSLIGPATGKGLNIIFSKIKLDGRDKTKTDNNLNASDLYNAYGTYNSIFSDSTLLASINTDQSAKLEYTFTKADDWGTGTPRWVTYGSEITNSLEYVNQEKNYSPDTDGLNNDFVNPVDSNTLSSAYDFTVGFLPYIKTPYSTATDTNGCFKRELKVNVQSASLEGGCGTYNDPYVIDDGAILEAIAAFIASGDTGDLQEIYLPKTYNNNLVISGERWDTGEGYHAKFTASGTSYISDSNTWNAANARKYLASAYYVVTDDIELSATFKGLGCGNNDNANGDNAFRGVIVGKDVPDSEGTHKATIVNKSKNPLINVSNGCVVKDVNVVVQNGGNTLTQSNTAYNNAYFGYSHQCAFYGGIIGEVMGGDNIIDNSYVTYTNSQITLAGNNGTLVPVGGFVGVVVFGGVIFKNMTASKTTAASTGLTVKYSGQSQNLADNDTQEDWAAIYVNPIVGRVINGYAINETTQFSVTENNKYHDDDKFARNGTVHTLKNGTKHYSIADVNRNETDKLDVSAVPTSATVDGTINIPNAQAFFILSLITQSCAGTAPNASGNYVTSLSYGTNDNVVYGMSHNADYSGVGEIKDPTHADYILAKKDTTSNTAVPYIIDRYCTNANARCVTSTSGFYDINLTSGVTYQLPDSFRGLGSVGNYETKYPIEKKNNTEGQDITEVYADRALNKYCIKLDVFNGNGCTVDEDIYLNKFQNDNYFDILHKGVNQNVSQNTQAYSPNARSFSHGIGLFDSIIMKDTASKLSDFTLTGSNNTEIYNNIYKTSKNDQIIKSGNVNNNLWLSVGGVVGWATNGTCLKFEKIQLNNLTVSGSSHVGGLLGFSGLSSTVLKIIVSECSANGITAVMTSSRTNESVEKSRNAIGTFVGKAYEAAVVIYGTSNGANNTDLTKYSEVKIKSFGFGNSNNQYTVAAGGLVGFAGHCCQVYDMKVSSSDSTVTIGNSKVRFAGGIVGGMQSVTNDAAETSCIALFKNCTVENIDVAGEYAGGFYGGKWDSAWTPYSITLDNCEMLGKAGKNSITASKLQNNACAGGFIGRGLVKTSAATNDSNILIKDCSIYNYNITAATSGNSGYAGGFVGYCSSNANNSTITCYIHDSSVENCVIGASSAYGGGAIGWVKPQNTSKENKMLGYNIKLNNVATNSGDKMGAWVGYLDNGKISIQFTGMAIYGDGFSKNVGGKHGSAVLTNESFVFADYMGKCINSTNNDVSGFNFSASSHVDMPRNPYVNVNPQSAMGTDEIISGDGGALYGSAVTGFSGKTSDKTAAAKIYADIAAGTSSRRYTTFDPNATVFGNKKIYDYLNVANGADGDRISTYLNEKGSLPAGVEDFAVVVIANQDSVETTNLINSYIQLVTNTSTNYTTSSSYYDIVVKSCVYNNATGKFEVTNDPAGLSWTNGSFVPDSDHTDSKKVNAFTLVDVQFKDPFNTTKIAYHLYVPVYTVKQMNYDFYTTVMSGTSSVSYNPNTGLMTDSIYENHLDEGGTHIDSLRTWFTQYVRFTYRQEDINDLLNSGDLDWNFNKGMIFDTQPGDNRLPSDTHMLLVDPNGGYDRHFSTDIDVFSDYQSLTGLGWELDFGLFKKNAAEYFAAGNFGDILTFALSRTASSDGKYVESDASDYDLVYIDNGVRKYYSFVSSGGDYDFSVSSDFNEDYYISYWVPRSADYDNELYYFSIVPEDVLSGRRSAKLQHKCETNNMFIADFYSQITSSGYEVGPVSQQITETDNEITVRAATTVTLNNKGANQLVKATDLYQSFKIILNRHLSDGSVYSDINGLSESGITAKYGITYGGYDSDFTPSLDAEVELDTSSYVNVIVPNSIMNDLIASTPTNNEYKTITIYTEVTMEFNPADIGAEFPSRGDSNSNVGVNVVTSSNLAFEKDRLASSSMTETMTPPSQNYYYVESINNATISYYASDELDEYDTNGRQSQNMSRLGINGNYSDEDWMPIDTEADYNVGVLDNPNAGDKVRLTLTLQKKTDLANSAQYVDISDIDDYVVFDSVTCGDTVFTLNQALSTSDRKVYEADHADCDLVNGYHHFEIAFAAKTGDGFTEYANYRVYLAAELYDTSHTKTVDNSVATDYIVYTNAKVFSEVINPGDVSGG